MKKKLAAADWAQQRKVPTAVGRAARIRKPELLKTASCPVGPEKMHRVHPLEVVQAQYSRGFTYYATLRLPEAGFISLCGGLR